MFDLTQPVSMATPCGSAAVGGTGGAVAGTGGADAVEVGATAGATTSAVVTGATLVVVGAAVVVGMTPLAPISGGSVPCVEVSFVHAATITIVDASASSRTFIILPTPG